MHQIHFLLGLCPRPRWGSLQCPRPLPLFKGPTSKGMEGNGREGRKGKGGGRGEVEGGIWPIKNFGVAPPMSSPWVYPWIYPWIFPWISTEKSVDMGVDMDGKFHIHGKPGDVRLRGVVPIW